jgi:toxin ParE1/3/4
VALALRFIGAFEVALGQLGARPSAGSPRYATELDLPGLRVWALKRFPYVFFYVDGSAQIDVWRLLHGEVHIPPWLHGGE